ncbi:MAG: hypothetical protein HYT75_02710 [Deltaproteobacteria bacterium]|nr:hypothetical protein [Deltaproteobacteria bacterium]MBI2341456.1 hypothetical protein [Deltaproteobacteria bacterium]
MIPPQIKRLAIAFTLFIGLFIAVRYFLVPKSFGKLGHYRADSIEEVAALPTHYAGQSICAGCHEEILKTKLKGSHAKIECETCHGAALKHTEDPMAVKPTKPKGRAFCGLCHSKNAARPKNMPQVDFEQHNAGMDCYLCHVAHNPRIK